MKNIPSNLKSTVISVAIKHHAHDLRVVESDLHPDRLCIIATFRRPSFAARMALEQELSAVLGEQVEILTEENLRRGSKARILASAMPVFA